MGSKLKSSTTSLRIIIRKRIPDAHQMHYRSEDDQHVKNIMRAAPDIEPAGFDGLRTSCAIEEGTQDQDPSFEKIIRHP